jgi:hypothetical protein
MILYPNLLKHNHVTLFWKTILERLSIGDAPFGTQIVNHSLVYNPKGMHAKEELSIKTSTIPQIISFFENIVGIKLTYIHFDYWKDIKRKIIKDNLIQDYVNRFQREYNLDTQHSNYMVALIQLYLTLKRITPDDIELEKTTRSQYPCTQIKSIAGVYYCPYEKRVKFSPEHIMSVTSNEEEEPLSEEEEESFTNEDLDLQAEDDNIE